MFRKLRIAVLLLLLLTVAGTTFWEEKLAGNWARPLRIEIFPLDGDAASNPEVSSYISHLNPEQFQNIGDFLVQQSQRYRLTAIPQPQITLEPLVSELPPTAPDSVRNPLAVIWWSLRLRSYVVRQAGLWHSLGAIKLFVIYHQGHDRVPLEWSMGSRKGLFGLVHAYAQARQNAQNNVVIAHELLHTLGASDEYDTQLQPRYPDGFADPDTQPHYPQDAAEIMAGRIPLSPTVSRMPGDLEHCVIGAKTAWEIGW